MFVFQFSITGVLITHLQNSSSDKMWSLRAARFCLSKLHFLAMEQSVWLPRDLHCWKKTWSCSTHPRQDSDSRTVWREDRCDPLVLRSLRGIRHRSRPWNPRETGPRRREWSPPAADSHQSYTRPWLPPHRPHPCNVRTTMIFNQWPDNTQFVF